MEEKKIKIAFLSVFYPFRGGIAQFNTEVFKALQEFADVKAFNFTTQYPSLLFPGKTQMVAENDPAPNFETPRYLSSVDPLTFPKTINAIKSYEPDVLITSYWMPFFAPSLGWVTKKLKKETFNIAICHNITPHEKRKGDDALNKFYLNQQNGFAVMSETVEKDLLRFVPDADYFLKPHPLYAQFGVGNNPNFKKDLKLGGNDKVLLFFGFIRKYKGLDILLNALKYLPETYKLIIAGEPYGSFDDYQKIIDEQGLADRVRKIVRYIPDEEVASIFENTDICVLPYRTATQSGIASIAKYYELPMVVTPVGELPNEVIPHSTGIVSAEVSPKSVADAILQINDELPEIKANLQSVKNENTWRKFAKEIIRLAE